MTTKGDKLKNLSTTIKVEGCGHHLKVEVAMRMQGRPNTLNLTFSQENRMADFNFKMKKQTFTKYKMPEVVNGFIPEVGGHVGILVERLDDLDHGIAEHHVQDVSKEHLAYVLVCQHAHLVLDIVKNDKLILPYF